MKYSETKEEIPVEILELAEQRKQAKVNKNFEEADRIRILIEEKGYLYPYKVLFTEPKVLVFCLISAIAGIGRYGLLTWVPTYFTEALGLSIKDGIFSSILLPLGQACAMFIFPLIRQKKFLYVLVLTKKGIILWTKYFLQT